MTGSCNDSLIVRAKRYSSIKYTLLILETAYLFILLLLFLYSGASKNLADSLLGVSPHKYIAISLYLLGIYLLYYLLNFPFTFYHSYLLEHKFSLSRQRFRSWLADQIKALALSYVIVLILIIAFYYILEHAPYMWWLVISLFWIFFTLIIAKLTPIVIIPLFFKYKKLSDEVLRTRIMDLAHKMGVGVLDCFQIDFSKKTVKANAAFVGVGRTRRVILADTLQEKYTHDEIEVILAHEFAHYKLKHLAKLILLNSLATVASFYAIYKTSAVLLAYFGFSSLSDIAALPVVLIYFLLFAIIMQPFENYVSRIMERNADRVALSVTGLKEAFVSMMEKLSEQNLSDRSPNPVIKFLFFDHPPIDERISMGESFSRNSCLA